MNRKILLLGIFLIGAIVFSCAPKAMPAAPIGGKPMPTEIEKEGWEKKWSDTISKAKRENRVSIGVWASSEVRDIVIEAFTSKYGIPVDVISGSGAEMAARVLREKKVGINSIDMMIMGSGTLLTVLKPAGILAPIEPELILPDVKDPKVWYGGDKYFLDQEKNVLAYMLYPCGGSIWTAPL